MGEIHIHVGQPRQVAHSPGPYREARTRFAIGYFAIGVVALAILACWRPEVVFHEQPTGDWTLDLPRAWWMVPWLAMGLSWRAWSLKDHHRPPHLEYLVAYPVAVIVAALFAFAILHSGMIGGLSGWLYYCAAPLVGLLIGYLAIFGLERVALRR